MNVLGTTVGTLAYRALGAAALDRGMYEGIEHDRRATVQAAMVVVASSLAAGIGATGGGRPDPVTLVAVMALALVTWISWALIILHIGGRYFAERQTHVDLGELMRTIGFAATPGLLQVFALIPDTAVPIYLASWLWMLAAMTVAVRQALDLRSMRRALLVCATALALVLGLAIVIGILFGPAAARAEQQPPRELMAPAAEAWPTQISATIEQAAALDRSARGQAVHADLRALYAVSPGALLWTDSAGRPTDAARTALDLLARSAEEGLRPADYLSPRLHALRVVLEAGWFPPAAEPVWLDVSLSLSMLRYMRELRFGRVDPRTFRAPLGELADDVDFVAVLHSAITHERVSSIAGELAPRLAQYRELRFRLASYRWLASGPALQVPLQRSPREVLLPEGVYSDAGTLYLRLRALGDLPPDTAFPQGIYTSDLAEGVKRFQRRHGLQDDGVLGPATWAALDVPIGWRIRQIELALERLRWLPRVQETRTIAIAIPMFRLWAWDSAVDGPSPELSMKVIVGRGRRTETPGLIDQLEYVVFGPYWNTPDSILRHEILPAIARDPDYLQKNEMEIVRGGGDDAQPVPATAANLDLVRAGVLRIRQRPGPRNALGLIKFAFPNDQNIYMHGTPAQSLFAASRRDFSHGCIRVEDPVALAAWALDDPDRWDRERIAATASTSISRRVDLERPIRVVLFYTTAAVWPEDGTMHFANDIYQRDAPLDRALEARYSP